MKDIRDLYNELGLPISASAGSRLLTARLGPFLVKLPLRLYSIIAMYYGLAGETSSTTTEIGRRLGISRGRAQQLKEKAVKILKSYVGPNLGQDLKFYLNLDELNKKKRKEEK